MKTLRIFTIAMALCFSTGAMAQKKLTEGGKKAQTALMDYLRMNSIMPTIDSKDNSVCFRKDNVLYWVTFEGEDPVLYTLHRTGMNHEKDNDFQPECATEACNEVNRRHNVKATYNDRKRVEFYIQTYAKEPAGFQDNFMKLMAQFNDVEKTYKEAYNQVCQQPVPKPTPLTSSNASFGSFDANGTVLTNYDQPLRKGNCRYIRARIEMSSPVKGLFMVGMKIISPDGRVIKAVNGTNYTSTTNIEVKKKKKAVKYELEPFGSSDGAIWKAGEYKVEFYDVMQNNCFYSTTFNIL